MSSVSVLCFFLLIFEAQSRVDLARMSEARERCESLAPEIKKYTFCLFKNMGFQNQNGEFQKDTLKKNFEGVLSDEKIEEIFAKCTVAKATPEESAHHAVICIENINRNISNLRLKRDVLEEMKKCSQDPSEIQFSIQCFLKPLNVLDELEDINTKTDAEVKEIVEKLLDLGKTISKN